MSLRRRKPKIDPTRVYLGRVLRPHGLNGEVKFHSFGCDPLLLNELEVVYSDTDQSAWFFEWIRGTDQEPIVKLKTVDTREAAESMKGTVFWVPGEHLPELESGLVYESDILFSEARDEEGNRLGRIESIIETGECDVLVIRSETGEECMVPASREFVLDIRTAESVVIIRPPSTDA